MPPPRRCARNEKKDKRSLVEKEIDTGACLIDADCKGLASVSVAKSVTVSGSVLSTKLLAGFALHITSPVIAVNGKVSCHKENTQDAHSKEMHATAVGR